MRTFCVVLLLVALPMNNTFGAIASERKVISLPGFGELAVVDGELWIVATFSLSLLQSKTPTDHDWLLLGTQIKSSASRLYLAFDKSGKDRAVLLQDLPGDDTTWQLNPVKDSKLQQPRDERFRSRSATIQVANGPRKGWYLDVAEHQQKVTLPSGLTVKGRRLVLSPPIKEPRAFVISCIVTHN